jgi:diguanylate cyclase (GGDEF)-like protein
MSFLALPWMGAALALLFLGLEWAFGFHGFMAQLGLLGIYPYAKRHPRAAWTAAWTLAAGIAALKWGKGAFPELAGWPEILAALSLVWLAQVLDKRTERQVAHFTGLQADRRAERAALERSLQEHKREISASSQQLRSVEHLFDVMREAGTTLNVQEMLGLAQEFTDRMFRFRHFVLGLTSPDGRRFEVRAASGCDETMLRAASLDRKAPTLVALLGAEGKPLYVPDTGANPRWTRPAELSIKSFLFVPFMVRDETIGFLCAFSRQDALLDEDRFQNLLVFCNQIAIGLQKALLYEKVQRLSITDGLTKLYSYRYFRQRLDEELVLAQRYGSRLSMLILDIDHFKKYNDTYGHLAGDQVLQEVGRLLRENSEASHLVARYGGEEMVVIAPETDRERARLLAERLRTAVETAVFDVGSDSTRVSVSIGVAVYPEDATTSLDLVARADKALYGAKSGGRNRVVVYTKALETHEKTIDTPRGEG